MQDGDDDYNLQRDIERQIEGEREEALIAKRALKDLINSKGWEILSRVLNAQLQMRVNHIVYGNAPSTPSEERAREYMRGEASALKIVLSLPTMEYENAKDISKG